MGLTLNIRCMGQEVDRGLKFLHDLDIGYENLHNNFKVSTIFACSFTAHFSNYRLYSLYYKYKSRQTLNGRFFRLRQMFEGLPRQNSVFYYFRVPINGLFRRKYIKTVHLC